MARSPFRLLTALVLALAAAAAPHAAGAATLAVNTTADAPDVSPGDGICATAAGACTLRAAIQEANALPGADAISVPAGAYMLSLGGQNEDAAATGDLDIAGALTIHATGVVLDAGLIDRALHVAPGANAIIEGLRVRNGAAVAGFGGGIFNQGTLTLRDVVVEASHSGLMGGAVASLGSLTVEASTFEGNTTSLNAAGIFSDGSLQMSDSLVARNVSSGLGGGVAVRGTATLAGVTVADNRALTYATSGGTLGGGGIGVFENSTLTLVETDVTGNIAWGTGGGIGSFGAISLSRTTVAGNVSYANGGGLALGAGSLESKDSTISGNAAQGSGGGITSLVEMTLTNTTLSGNMARENGGAVFARSTRMTLRNATITANVADADRDGTGDGGGLSAFVVAASNSIVAGNTDTGGQAPDCSARLATEGHNLLGAAAGCTILGSATGDVVGAAASLGPLAANGGPTRTHALLAGSPAIDAGDPAPAGSGPAACPANDQRGIGRPQGTRCDIGAFEREP